MVVFLDIVFLDLVFIDDLLRVDSHGHFTPLFHSIDHHRSDQGTGIYDSLVRRSVEDLGAILAGNDQMLVFHDCEVAADAGKRNLSIEFKRIE